MPFHFKPCSRPPLKWLYGRFRGYRPHRGRPAAVLLPPWIPHTVRLCDLDRDPKCLDGRKRRRRWLTASGARASSKSTEDRCTWSSRSQCAPRYVRNVSNVVAAYFKGYPWTSQSIAKARHALLLRWPPCGPYVLLPHWLWISQAVRLWYMVGGWTDLIRDCGKISDWVS
jgi:hypothetical protein